MVRTTFLWVGAVVFGSLSVADPQGPEFDRNLLERLARSESAEARPEIDLDALPEEVREELVRATLEITASYLTKPMKRLRGDYFTVLSDLLENESIQNISSNLDATFEVLGPMLGVELPDQAQQIPVYVYRYQEGFETVAEIFGVSDSVGFYLRSAPLLAFGVHVPADPSQIAYISGQTQATIMIHEATHAFLDRHVFPDGAIPPYWLDEGVAEYVGNSEIRRGKLLLGTLRRKQRVRVAHVSSHNIKSKAYVQIELLRKHMRKNDGPSVPQLLAAGREQFYGPDHDAYYAASWVLIHYFHHGYGMQRERFRQLIRKMADGTTSEAAVAAVYGDLDKLDREFRRYVKSIGR